MHPVSAPSLSEQDVSQLAPADASASPRITAPPLVGARWLADNVDRVRIIDTRPAAAHEAGHVPGACSLPLDALLVEDTSRPALDRLARAAQAALAVRGIGPDDHALLVDDADGSASLGAVVCELAGMRRVSVVHGSGTDAWCMLGGTLAEHATSAAPADAHAWSAVAPRSTTVAAFEDIVDAVVSGTARIIDARSQLEHEGIVGAPCCPTRGCIPLSVHVEWTAFFDFAGEPHPSERVRQIVEHVGLDAEEPLIVTCHAGHRAAIAARVLRSVGFRDVRVSLGSWHEWSARGLAGSELPGA